MGTMRLTLQIKFIPPSNSQGYDGHWVYWDHQEVLQLSLLIQHAQNPNLHLPNCFISYRIIIKYLCL